MSVAPSAERSCSAAAAAVLLLLIAAAAPAADPPAAVELPAPRHGHRAHVVGDELFVFGGFCPASSDDRGRRETFACRLADGVWRRLPDLHRGRAFFSSVVIDGAIYALGDGIERLDRGGSGWTRVLDDGLPTSHFSAAAIGGRIYVVGGYPAERSAVWVYDTASGTLERAEPFPGFDPTDHFHIVAALDDGLHVIGGLDTATSTPTAEHSVLRDGAWQRLPDAPAPLWAKFAVQSVVDDHLYVFTETGGWRYAPDGSWKRLAAMAGPRAMPASYVRGGRIHVVGGTIGGDAAPATTYDPRADRWTRRARNGLHRDGEPLPAEILHAAVRSLDNANTKFFVSVEVALDEALSSSLETELVVGGTRHRQTSGGSGNGRSHLGFELADEGAAAAAAALFGVEPILRRHPGHRLRVEFAADDDLRATLRLTNVGDVPVAFMQGGRNRAARDNQYDFSARLVGEQVRDIGTSLNFGGLAVRRVIEPGETFEDAVDLRLWFAFDAPGHYEVLGSYSLAHVDEGFQTLWEEHVTAPFTADVPSR